MIISVASDKGGTGKTTIATNMAVCLGTNVQFLDCDVEEPNAHLFIQPAVDSVRTISTPVPKVDIEKCTYCGKCMEICQFKAIAVINETVLTFQELCHSCGGCVQVCPEKAITETGRELGVIETGHRNGLEFIHGRLRVGEAMSPPLIKKVREQTQPGRLTIIDAPPGKSCPVIASIGGATAVLILAEPTVSGRHDTERVAELAAFFKVPAMICINKFDLNPDEGQAIEAFAKERHIRVVGRVPFDPAFTEAMIQGKTIVEFSGRSEGCKALKSLWKNLMEQLYLLSQNDLRNGWTSRPTESIV
jgi:MinD superfamily P-loop ATPase